MNLIDLSDEDGRRALHAEEGEPETDEERLEKLKKIRDTLRQVRMIFLQHQISDISRWDDYLCIK